MLHSSDEREQLEVRMRVRMELFAKDPERREHVTLRIIAISFFALAAFVTVDASNDNCSRLEADTSQALPRATA